MGYDDLTFNQAVDNNVLKVNMISESHNVAIDSILSNHKLFNNTDLSNSHAVRLRAIKEHMDKKEGSLYLVNVLTHRRNSKDYDEKREIMEQLTQQGLKNLTGVSYSNNEDSEH
jgi:diketogulonate reductase-like aldo/keto reductase